MVLSLLLQHISFSIVGLKQRVERKVLEVNCEDKEIYKVF